MSQSGTARPADDAGLTIGRVLARLQGEFPDLTPSKLRYLEAQGLVTPERTSGGYRSYSEDDVERLRSVLTLQSEQYWPLEVIAEHLEAEAGEQGQTPGGVDVDARTLRSEHDLTAGQFRELIALGLVQAGSDHTFDHQAQEVVAALAPLLHIGVEPRHLRPLLSAVRRDLDLAEHLAASADLRGADPAASESGRVASMLGVARVALMRREAAARGIGIAEPTTQ